MASLRTLAELVREIEETLTDIDDPIERLRQSDAIRADISVILTEQNRRSAYQARRQGRLNDLSQESWRKRRYLIAMAEQYRKANGFEPVQDILTKHLLDLRDLARLRGER